MTLGQVYCKESASTGRIHGSDTKRPAVSTSAFEPKAGGHHSERDFQLSSCVVVVVVLQVVVVLLVVLVLAVLVLLVLAVLAVWVKRSGEVTAVKTSWLRVRPARGRHSAGLAGGRAARKGAGLASAGSRSTALSHSVCCRRELTVAVPCAA